MAGNEAKIRIGIEGTNDVRNALRMVKNEFGGVEGVLKGIAQGALRLGADISKAATGMKAIDFGAATDKARAFEDQLTRLSVRSGKPIDDLRQRFAKLGVETGMGAAKFADAVKGYDKINFSGLDEASEAVRILNENAQDTGRSLEEMLSAGGQSFVTMGTNAAKFRDELSQIRGIASDTRTNFLGLEDSANKLAGTMARLQGGKVKGTATLGAIQERGYSPQVANELYERIHGTLAGEGSTHLVRQAAASAGFKGDVYVKDPNTGRPMLSKGALRAVQKYTARKPLYGVAQYFGGGAMGEEAARLFRDPSFLDRADDLERAAVDRQEATDQIRGKIETGKGYLKRFLGVDVPRGSVFSGTDAGQQEKRDAEREQYETGLGKKLLTVRQRREKSMTAEERAKWDTAHAYLGNGVMQDAWSIGAAGYYMGGDANYKSFRMYNDPRGPGHEYQAPPGAMQPTRGGRDPLGGGGDKFLDALKGVADSIKGLPKAVTDGLQKADIKVRANPVGASTTNEAGKARVN